MWKQFFSGESSSSSPSTSGWHAAARSILLTSAVMTAVLAGMRSLALLQPAELAVYDQMIRWRRDRGPDQRVLLVEIAEEDIQALQEETVSDLNLYKVLTELEKHQPIAIGIDILRDVPIGQGREQLTQLFAKSDKIIAVCKASGGDTPGVRAPLGIPDDRIGTADQSIDPDGAIRRALLFMTPSPPKPGVEIHPCNNPNKSLIALSMQLADRYLYDTQQIELDFLPDNTLKLGNVVIPRMTGQPGGYQKIDTDGYQIMLDYRSASRAIPTIAFRDVLAGKVDPEMVRNRIVFVGYTAPSKKDDFLTPYSAGQKETAFKMPGVTIHAQISSQLLGMVLDGQRPIGFWHDGGETLWILGWCLVGGLTAWRVRHPMWFASTIVLAMGSTMGIGFLLFSQATWVPVAAPLIGLLASGVGVLSVDRFEKGGYARKIYQSVRRFLKIEIDEEERSRQVSEITESDYFKKLKDKSQTLQRGANEGEDHGSPRQEVAPAPISPAAIPSVAASNEPEGDYMSRLLKKAQNLRQQIPEGEVGATPVTPPDVTTDGQVFQPQVFQPQVIPPTVPPAEGMPVLSGSTLDSDSSGLDFLQSIQNKAQSLRQHRPGFETTAMAADPSPVSSMESPPPAQGEDIPSAVTLALELTATEQETLQRYCQRTGRDRQEVLREFIRGLEREAQP